MRTLILPTLGITEQPDPVPGEGQLLVRVHAAGLNRADLSQRAGKYPAPAGWPADIPGLEYAGEVVGLGPGATYFGLGERVMGLVGGGAMAELIVVHQREAMSMPAGMSFGDAAAIPEAFLTAWDALVRQGRARGGDRVLIHAVGSGVGTAASQLAPLLSLTLIGTSRTPDKLDRCRELGMTLGVLTTDADWAEQVGEPVAVIIDTLGGDLFTASLGLLAYRGRLVVLGLLAGRVADELDLGLVLRNRLTIVGTAMRSRGAEERGELIERFTQEVLPHFGRGTLRPIVDQVVPMREAAAAYDLLASNRTFGKVVLAWD
ncbi:MAG TPA: NAD(P)H-quinone oxidoreductase [Gemmatimonadales bacterium]|nr:NAD(P)H-quinone oxidoreductase [Gemmatimonadales bacterium]